MWQGCGIRPYYISFKRLFMLKHENLVSKSKMVKWFFSHFTKRAFFVDFFVLGSHLFFPLSFSSSPHKVPHSFSPLVAGWLKHE